MNIAEFARRAGFSTATVSRAFHEPAKLRPATRERVLSIAQELGYYPDSSGRALKRGRHDVLGAIWPLEVEGPEAAFAQRILAALTSHLVANDLDLLVCPIDRRDSATLAHAHRTLQRSRCDAWILLYPRHHDALIKSLENSRKPVVCLMGSLTEQPSWKCVRLDQRSWIEDALRRFRNAGCRSVSFLGARPGEPDHEERQQVFAELAPRYFGRKVSSLRDWPPQSSEFRKYLTAQSVDAIIAADDHTALAILDLCQMLGLVVPDQIKLVGIDDLPEARHSSPALSSYRQPLREMAGCAVELALGTRQRSRLFEAVFVPRQSLPES